MSKNGCARADAFAKRVAILDRAADPVMKGREDRDWCARIVVEVMCGGRGPLQIAEMVEVRVRCGVPD